MKPSELTEVLRKRAHELGFELVGFCDASPPVSHAFLREWIDRGMHGVMDFMPRQTAMRASLESVVPGACSVVAVGLNYNQPVEQRPTHPKVARYALGRDYHRVMRRRLAKLAGEILLRFPDARARACVDSAPLMERELAQRAGLGWFGKNTCLINSERGSWFLLGFLVTDVPLEYDEAAIGGCGSCSLCIEACPTGAIVRLGHRWAVDSRRCISALTIETAGEKVPDSWEGSSKSWTFGCDICQEVCPFNRPRESQPLRARETSDPDIRADRTWPTLAELSEWSEEDWDRQTLGSATRRAKVEMWRRNARMNLETKAVQPIE